MSRKKSAVTVRSASKAYVGGITEAISEIINEYGARTRRELNIIIPDVAKDTVKEIQSNIERAGIGEGKAGRYAKGWKSTVKTNPYGDAMATVYQGNYPGLPHLLEYSHALRNGGRSKPMEHIKPAEEWAEAEIVKRVKEALS